MRAAFIAFSMYSRIPMPMFEWKEEDMKYAMCFFPAIGMVIGAVFYGMFLLLSWLRESFSQFRSSSQAESTWMDLWTRVMQGRPTETGRRNSRS